MYKTLSGICKFSFRTTSDQTNRIRPFIRLLTNNYTTGTGKMSIVTIEEIEDLPNRPESILVDVRDPPEIKDTGNIPTAINIPLGTLEETLKLPADAFKERFGRDKPNDDAELIFSCKLGGRATKAAEVAAGLGFTNAKIYQGSWTEWAAKKGL